METAERPFAEVERELRAGFRERFDLRVTVERAAPESLPRYELEARRYRRA